MKIPRVDERFSVPPSRLRSRMGFGIGSEWRETLTCDSFTGGGGSHLEAGLRGVRGAKLINTSFSRRAVDSYSFFHSDFWRPNSKSFTKKAAIQPNPNALHSESVSATDGVSWEVSSERVLYVHNCHNRIAVYPRGERLINLFFSM